MEAAPYGVVHFFPGGTKDQYEASIAAVHPGEGLLQAGIEGGFESPPEETVVDLYKIMP
ncbi:hypothetical protein ABH924_002453 [Arthrobacter sp. GAS37]|uniref:hypothetical protein n=1 Tax=Arthrobacter sp. GAS37 TaxID=3156261 RepID=UPI003838B176